jgi:hypothetical protein
MIIPALGLAIVAVVVGFVLFSHWNERYGNNHY